MTFSEAFEAMRRGQRVRRQTWEAGVDVLVRDEQILCRAADRWGSHVSPWVPTQSALFASDWESCGSAAHVPSPR